MGTGLDLEQKKTSEELRCLAGQIFWYEEEARKTVGLALQYKLEIGRRLLRAKEIIPHGEFLDWAQHEFGWSARHVQNHLMLAANAKRVSHLAPGASLRMALAAIKESSQIEALKPAKPTPSALALQVHQSGQRIHLIGEIDEGAVDCDQLLLEVARITASLGAPKARWKARLNSGAAAVSRSPSIV
jgi:hypothetical protein